MILRLEDRNGGLRATAVYSVPSVLRERTIHVDGFVYEQSRRGLERSTWVYREVGLSSHTRRDYGITSVTPATAQSVVPVTWADVDKWFADHRGHEPIAMSQVRDLESLVQQARGHHE